MVIVKIDEHTLFCVDTNTRFIFESSDPTVGYQLIVENIFTGARVTIAEGQPAIRTFKEIKNSAGWPPVEY